MKIGIETECLSQTVRGIGIYTLALLEALCHEEVLCYHTSNQTQALFPHFSHHFFRKRSSLPFSNSLASLFHHRCFDLVNVLHFPEPKILYGKKPKVPFILTIHDVMPLKFPQFFSYKHQMMMRVFLPRYLREAAAIIAVSEQTKKDLLEFFPLPEEKVHLIHPPLPSQKRVVSEEKEPYFLYIGSFEPRKNLDGIIEAFGQIKAKQFPHKLILAGKEEGSNRLPHKLIEKLNLKDEVILKGYVLEEEKLALFQKAQLLVWPSFYEGFGLPLLEAMASGTPIVTSNCSAPKEIVGDAALCVDPQDSHAIAKAMEDILSSQNLSKSLMEKGLSRASLYSLDRFREKYLKLLFKVSI